MIIEILTYNIEHYYNITVLIRSYTYVLIRLHRFGLII